MGWETRSGRRYYYSKKRVGKQVISVYRGQAGSLAELLEACHRQEREEQSAREWQNSKQLIQSQDKLDHIVNQYSAQVRKVVAVVLEQIGYRKHKGQWRMPRKMGKLDIVNATQQEIDEFEMLARQAEKPSAKRADVDRFSDFVDEHPTLFDRPSQLARTTLGMLIDSGNATAFTKVLIKAEVAALRRSLGEASASSSEKLLIEDVAICWLRLQLIEQGYSQNTSKASIQVAEHWERRLSAARKRYLQSIETLAKVRRLLSRAGVQINVAEQQVVVNG